MPNIPTHIHLALDVSLELGTLLEFGMLGQFLLGSTSPDIRAITKTHRQDTHFASLDSLYITEGVDRLLHTYPELTDSKKISRQTRAFIAGYICHLIADQTWVIEIYRPYFGNRSLFSDPVEANVYDRALQLKLDSDCLDSVRQASDNLDGAELGVELPFITKETLKDWRAWVVKFCHTEFSWDRLNFMALRQDPVNHEIAVKVANNFIENSPIGLELITQRLPWSKVVNYHQSVVAKATEMVQEYLYEHHSRI